TEVAMADIFDTLADQVWDRINPRDFTVRDLADALREVMTSKSPCANQEHDWSDGRCQRCGFSTVAFSGTDNARFDPAAFLNSLSSSGSGGAFVSVGPDHAVHPEERTTMSDLMEHDRKGADLREGDRIWYDGAPPFRGSVVRMPGPTVVDATKA